MRLLIDNQLPVALALFFRERGHEAIHVLECGCDELSDSELWTKAASEQRIVVSKDQDFVFLAHRPGDTGKLIWIRLGNCRNAALIESISRVLGAIEVCFANGQRLVEVR